MTDELTQDQRYPWLDDDSRRLLAWLHEHPSAPRFNHHCGDRLSPAGLERVRAFEDAIKTADPGWQPGQPPAWLSEFLAFCCRDVPFYRQYGTTPASLADVPTSTRADLSRAPWRFVPNSLPLDDLIVYNTSGTTGHPLDILSDPENASKYLPLLRAVLGRHGVTLEGGRHPATGQLRVGLLLVCFQHRTYTYASVSSFLGGAGFAKINLEPSEWRTPGDRARFIDACQPEIFTGDPLSFAELARLSLRHRPKALISTAMQLLPGLRQALAAHFGCPVIDLYAMNEAGPIAVGTSAGHVLLQPHLYVEVLDDDGRSCPPGVRGEITLTGGFNPFIPLLRYRTGDFASLAFSGSQPLLVGLEGRPPVIFRGAAGQAINNIDVTGALKPFALAGYQLHQTADGALQLSLLPSSADPGQVRAALLGLFGPDQELEVVTVQWLGGPSGKVVQYTRAEAEFLMPTMPSGPLVVVWRVTEACDLSCWFCEYNRRLRRPRYVSRAEDVLQFGQVLADYRQSTQRSVLVSWLGGEPLVWPPLVEVGQRFQRDFGLMLGLTTNGWQLEKPGLIQHLAETYSEITISVDGLAAVHDDGRDAPGLFERLRAAIGNLHELKQRQAYGPRLRANTILMRSNLHSFEGLCCTLAQWGIEEVTFNALGGRPPGPHFQRERLQPDDLSWLQSTLPSLRQRLAAQGLRLLGTARYLRRLASSAAVEAAPVLDCHPAADFIFVDEQGRVAPCAFTRADYGLPIHEFQSGADVVQLPIRFAAARQSELAVPCRDCCSTQVFGKFELEGSA